MEYKGLHGKERLNEVKWTQEYVCQASDAEAQTAVLEVSHGSDCARAGEEEGKRHEIYWARAKEAQMEKEEVKEVAEVLGDGLLNGRCRRGSIWRREGMSYLATPHLLSLASKR